MTRHTLRESRAVGRVLVCVGDPLGRCIAARVLEKRGHAVVVLDEPEAAVDALAGDLFDAVVVDAQGDRAAVAHAAAASRARRFEGGAGSALIFLTSGMKRDGRSAQPLPEADAWLELPVDAARLAEIVEVVEPSSSPTPPGGGESERALVDMDAALERAGGDRALVADLADTLIVDARGRVRTMREAVARGDTRAIETEAHAIRSSLGVFGADAMLRVATRLEEAGRVGDLGAASETLAELVSALGRLEPVLREIAAGGRDVSCGGGTTR